ncbi:DNA cytosine methyltransferase [Paraglaciecola psychrophila]|uniref:DNA (cytosine-5-)-methyltransferase n=1 Tax=Paraglaciecola psychrophila 170 TaxID=1129794 RepID=K7ANB4_9ALTE|nr:DNA cytosine methyltransferase [Paraglaciecola psychrophila]AGH44509.1 C-5 cytosine-specific DNA methylase [Paraglaciecola psychrophila 170]GAC36815.1 DNA (cytosine-5-)-methyltransferase [Paraglaciecola psychrophila 170]
MSLFKELLVDNFAGGGGASQGIYESTGRHVDIAINHDIDAIQMHEMNHPETQHFCESVWDIDPRKVVNGLPVGLAWFSPDCKHFSKAKGSKPVSKNIRGLAWIVIRWAATTRPRVIMLENVEEFKTWGPLLKDGMPDKDKKGQTFNSFVNALKRQGYQVEFKELRACDYGAPTIRKRLFLVARRDGKKIEWPKPTHAAPDSLLVKRGKLKPWKTAAECIDWSIPCPSIFERKKPLAENTLKRIAKGIQRYVIDSDKPFIVNEVAPFITEHANASNQRNMPLNEPLRTICAGVKGGHFALVTAFIAKHYTGVVGVGVDKPLPTVTTKDHNSLVTSHIIKLRGTNVGHKTDEPLHTITAGGNHHGEVRAFLIKYYGNEKDGCNLNEPLHTVTTRDRFGLVTIKGEDYQIVDIGMRMFSPRELFNAQGFPSDYIIDIDKNGNKVTKQNQVARCGNSVSPPLAKALVDSNMPEIRRLELRA